MMLINGFASPCQWLVGLDIGRGCSRKQVSGILRFRCAIWSWYYTFKKLTSLQYQKLQIKYTLYIHSPQLLVK